MENEMYSATIAKESPNGDVVAPNLGFIDMHNVRVEDGNMAASHEFKSCNSASTTTAYSRNEISIETSKYSLKSCFSTLLDLENGRSNMLNQEETPNPDFEPCYQEDSFVTDWDSSHVLEATLLPPKIGPRIYRLLRWTMFSTYRRLFLLIILVNLGILAILLFIPHKFTHRNILNVVAANISLSVVIRQEHVVNALFLVFGSVSQKAPLRLRRWAAKIYSFGGIHSGCGVAATLWYITYTIVVTRHLSVPPLVEPTILVLTYVNFMFLVAILVFAHPAIRSKIHNWFEAAHRYGGWTATIFFWVQTFLICRHNSIRSHKRLYEVILTAIPFWNLIIISICLIYPWLYLRRHQVQAEFLSSHALRIYFSSGHPKSCQSLRISDNPLRETHAFVTLPNLDGSQGFSMIVSAAGDWTTRIIRNPPSHLWIKGIPFYGVMRLALLFKSVILVATGSGIAPCLSLLCHRPRLKCRILWSTPSPVDIYGEPILDMVLDGDPEAMIVDTKLSGRPDLVSLAWNSYKNADAEAVFVVSNAKVTKKVVYGLETRGVPAFAPIFDS